MMAKARTVYVLGAVVVLLCGAAFYYYATAGSSPYIRLSNSTSPTPMPAAANPTTPVGPVPITAVSATSITVRVNDSGETFTYAIGTSTHVYSLAAEGKAGKSFGDLAKDVKVTVYPVQDNTAQALAIAFLRDPSLVPSQADIQTAVTGVVTALSGGAVTIAPKSGDAITITLDPSTKVVTTVIEGQVGRPLSVGEHVGVTGVATTDGKTTASMILMAPKLPN